MQAPTPHFLEAGAGSGVVCLHASASVASQWRPLIQRLAPRHHVLAPDLLGAGRSPAWRTDRAPSLDDERALIEPVLARAGKPLVLVGHSYGGSVALATALAEPTRVRAIAVFEPTLFGLLEEERPGQPASIEIRRVARDSDLHVRAGHLDAAARRFVDYWTGTGSWDRVEAKRQPAIAASMVNVARWFEALFSAKVRRASLAELRIPVLLMVGGRSPASSRSVARLLASALPNVRLRRFPELGHMGPITDAELVNEAIAGFVAESPPAGPWRHA